ncbi:MAG: single-stranded DNA-binding protein [Planctomycetes bacterium]|nr:single-stranded DNA-binding protein [Planctomycetota bacterium]
MASYNRVILMGNLTRDPELRYIPSGTAVSNLGLAVNDRVKRNDQWIDEVTFVDVTLWARDAEIANEYLSKGSPVLIEGRLKLDQWEKDGQKHSKLKVVCDRLRLVGSRDGSRGGGRGGSGSSGGGDQSHYDEAEQYMPAGAPPPNDDIPF